MATKKDKKDNSHFVAILIVVLILLCGITLAIVLSSREKSAIMVDKPQVSVPIGTEYKKIFTTKMSFEGNIEELQDMSEIDYKQAISDALNSIGYEKLTSQESAEYVKKAVKKELTEKFKKYNEDFNIESIYISELIESNRANPTGKSSNPNNPNSNDVADMFKTK